VRGCEHASSLEQRAVTEMDAIEVADRDDGPLPPESVSMTANDLHDGRQFT